MPCGYCGAPNRTVRQCSCVRARRYVAANLKGGAANAFSFFFAGRASSHPDIPLGAKLAILPSVLDC